PNRRAKGIVIESSLDKGQGPIATILVQNGTLHIGDIVIAGTAVGRVRSMETSERKNEKAILPGYAVKIAGLAEVPSAGDEFNAVEDEKMARSLAEQRRAKMKEESNRAKSAANLDELFAQISEGTKKLDIIVKADVAGSVEAVKAALLKLSNDEVRVSVIHTGVGAITEGDVMLATASNAIIVGFNVRPDKSATDSAERHSVDIRTYRVIYECINEIQDAMKGMLDPVYKENMQGRLEIRKLYHVPGVSSVVAGCYVLDGKVTRHSLVRVVRDGIVMFDRRAEEVGEYSNKLSSLYRYQDAVKEVAAGYECAVTIARYDDLKVGDILEMYTMDEVAR
ncbi:MAG: translation initiation factor IF-2, partial [Clostridia bacterium]|nr:translation initiation factor IF-2 [Clostridia bacterium]